MGPTASGKTDLAVELAQNFPYLQVISVDSALVYRGLDIGAAKPSQETLSLVPHRLIDICEPHQPYSAGDFRRDVLTEINKIHQQGKIPFLVGGSLLYFWVLENGLAVLPQADPEIRRQISQRAALHGWEALHNELKIIDEKAAAQIHPHDCQRIQRALEIYFLTGKPMSSWQTAEIPALPFSIQHFILFPEERSILTSRIEARLNSLFEQGFIEEVEALRLKPEIHADLPAMRTVGYRQIWDYLEGQYDLAATKQRAYFATCQLAKRQLTWLRRWPNAHWFSVETPKSIISEKISQIIRAFSA